MAGQKILPLLLILFVTPASSSFSSILTCNETLEAGSTMYLDSKLDLVHKFDDSSGSLPWPCAVLGPDDPADEPATIYLPDDDCALITEGEVILSGSLRFVVGNKTKDFDCCDDGESHGSILCSYSNLTVSSGSVILVETTGPEVIIDPGGFWTGEYITVHGTVNATLRPGAMTGVNGLLSSGKGVRISSTGTVIAHGQHIARGAAVQGGDYGTVIEGTVICSSYHASSDGGCVAGGAYTIVRNSGLIQATHGNCLDAGCVVSAGKPPLGKFGNFEGRIEAKHIHNFGSGAVVAADYFTMSGNASIIAENVTSLGGSTVMSCGNFTMQDNAKVFASEQRGADAGVIGVTLTSMRGSASIECNNAYASNCGACVLSSIELEDSASISARNVVGGALGGAICGGYPGQYFKVSGDATIDISNSSAGLFGGAIFAHEIDFGRGNFAVHLKDTTANCGAAIATIDDDGNIG